MELKKTALHSTHIELEAKMTPFAGFEMPLQYKSAKDEVYAVRHNAGIFDVSHMGEFFVEGPEAVKFIDFLITNDFLNAGKSKAVYSPLCRDDGTIIDDLIVYKLSKERVLICVNASNIQKDWDWISQKVSSFNCILSDKSNEFSLLAVQGPQSEKILSSLNLLGDDEFPYYSVKEREINNKKIIVSRTGYTGEDGFEIFCPHEAVPYLWETIVKKGAKPCGLLARDILRLEVCYPLYGHELNDEITPLDCALKWTVKFNKEQFVGKEALSNYQIKYRLVKLSIPKGIPREGYDILNEEGQVIGKVTSGTMSLTNGNGICLALIQKDKFPANKIFLISVRKKTCAAEYHQKAFVTGEHK